MVIGVVIAESNREVNRQLSDIVSRDRKLTLKGSARTGLETVSHVMRQRPEVLVMGANMPDLDITSIIKRVMGQHPVPILVLHQNSHSDIVQKIKRMELGIVDFLEVNDFGNKLGLSEVSFTTRIHILSKLNIQKFRVQIQQGLKLTRKRHNLSQSRNYPSQTSRQLTRNQSRSRTLDYSGSGRSSKVIIIGTSTGGPRLLSELVPKFPPNLPPVIIVQHMPVGFITAFSRRLDRMSRIRVKEAESGENIVPGQVYMAPGGKHLEFYRPSQGIPKILLTDGEPVNFVKPAVDVTLKSAVSAFGNGVISVILTGMGSDGKEGSISVKNRGGKVLALNESDSDIYGMNRSVIEAGAADEVLGKKEIVLGIIRAIEGKI